jgi:hypothetical protein
MVYQFGVVKELSEEGTYSVYVTMAFFIGRSLTVA